MVKVHETETFDNSDKEVDSADETPNMVMFASMLTKARNHVFIPETCKCSFICKQTQFPPYRKEHKIRQGKRQKGMHLN